MAGCEAEANRRVGRLPSSWIAVVASVQCRSQGPQCRLAAISARGQGPGGAPDLAHANGFGCTSADKLTASNRGLPLAQSRLLAGTLYYKLNNWVTFAFEQSQYQTTLLPDFVDIGVIHDQGTSGQ
ncbi:MAG TPA: hypothetical protein VIX37_18410 [Candidatus Sulfotelmatobacter sp.]